MSLGTGQAKLKNAHKDLLLQWDRVRMEWDDPASRHIQATYLDALESQISSALSAMDHMAELVHRARRECQ